MSHGGRRTTEFLLDAIHVLTIVFITFVKHDRNFQGVGFGLSPFRVNFLPLLIFFNIQRVLVIKACIFPETTGKAGVTHLKEFRSVEAELCFEEYVEFGGGLRALGNSHPLLMRPVTCAA